MTITALPTPPTRSQPSTFSALTDAFLGALPTFVTEANALGSQASTDASTASTAAIEAVAASSTAVAVVGSVKWVSGTTYAIGACVWSPTNYLVYRRKTAGAGTTDPMSDPTNWQQLVKTQVVRSARTSNTILALADDRNLIDVTSGTFSQTFSACASLGSGWSIIYRNAGTGIVTLDPNGSETVDGVASCSIHPGESRLVQCDGSALRTIVLNSGTGGVLHVREQKASGTIGDVSGGGAGYTIRTINTTMVNTLDGASVASNEITLSIPGTYHVTASARCVSAVNQLAFKNVTDGTYPIVGMSGIQASKLEGTVTITAAKAFSFAHWASTSTQFGQAINSGMGEIYLEAVIRRMA